MPTYTFCIGPPPYLLKDSNKVATAGANDTSINFTDPVTGDNINAARNQSGGVTFKINNGSAILKPVVVLSDCLDDTDNG